MTRTPFHECRWFVISEYEDGTPALYACGVTMRCIKTLTAKEWNAKKKQPTLMERPYE